MTYGDKSKEGGVKDRLTSDYFGNCDTAQELSGIDFAVAVPDGKRLKTETEWLLWAEEKHGTKSDVTESLIQLVLTIGKARLHEKLMPPKYLGTFDAAKIAFVPYEQLTEVFAQNDFNWNVLPSSRATKEIRQLKKLLDSLAKKHLLVFDFDKDDKALRKFITRNFKFKTNSAQIQIAKNNYIYIFHKWLEVVKPTIDCYWRNAREFNIFERDFYLADILNRNNSTIKERLKVLFSNDRYVVRRGASIIGGLDLTEIYFTDAPKRGREGFAHKQFWSRYKRPPHKAYWDFMVTRSDLLVLPDARSYKGAFFTPEAWVSKSHEYLRQCLGDNWQKDYYIWDCTAGTGNMEAGLTNKENVWASTLDQSDVEVLHKKVSMGANLLDSHIFQFDFLNDSFDELPDDLRKIIESDTERRRLVIYFNPPSVEAGSSMGTMVKKGVSNQSRVHQDYSAGLGSYAKRELGAQFLMRIYREIPDCVIGIFAKLKILQSPYFKTFRNNFKAKLLKMFIVPANTFDNVTGSFPYGFMVFDTKDKQVFRQTVSDVYDERNRQQPGKTILSYDGMKLLNDWLRPTWSKRGLLLGRLSCNSNDFSQQNTIVIQSRPSNNSSTFFKPIYPENLVMSCIYFAVRKCVPATWTNDRDQYLCPNDEWKQDWLFQGDCLAYALFNNIIQEKYGTNYWIPYSEEEVGAKGKFKSHFMHDFILGKQSGEELDLFSDKGQNARQLDFGDGFEPSERHAVARREPMEFSDSARAVLDAGRVLWQYYHEQDGAKTDASYYDIRLFFQGSKPTKSGKEQMNATSQDARYMEIIENLRRYVRKLASEIEPKVYEYGFLKR